MRKITPELNDEIVDLVASRLARADADLLTEAAQRDPILAAEIATLTAMRDELQAEIRGNDSKLEFGWARLSKALDEEQRRARAVRTVQRWQAIAALAVIACVGQAGAIVMGSIPRPARYETAAIEASTPFAAQVTFSPAALESDLRAVLLAANAQIVEGPSSLGVYRVAFDSEDARASGLAAFSAADRIVTFAAAQ